MKPKARLGRGIDAIFADTLQDDTAIIVEIPATEIYPNPSQPRKTFDDKSISELAESIKSHGLISPIVVRKMNSKYEIIAGERRYQACKVAGLTKIPAMVKDISDADAFKISLVENLQREDLNPMEEAEAYYTLKEQFSLTHQDIAVAVNKDRSTVTNSMRLVNLPLEAKAALKEGTITTGHARTILMVESGHGQAALLSKIISHQLSVREAERLASSKGKKKKTGRKVDPYLENISEQIGDRLGVKVMCTWAKSKGKIVINVGSREELQRIVQELCRHESPL